jgi:hypothetical protein
MTEEVAQAPAEGSPATAAQEATPGASETTPATSEANARTSEATTAGSTAAAEPAAAAAPPKPGLSFGSGQSTLKGFGSSAAKEIANPFGAKKSAFSSFAGIGKGTDSPYAAKDTDFFRFLYGSKDAGLPIEPITPAEAPKPTAGRRGLSAAKAVPLRGVHFDDIFKLEGVG